MFASLDNEVCSRFSKKKKKNQKKTNKKINKESSEAKDSLSNDKRTECLFWNFLAFMGKFQRNGWFHGVSLFQLQMR